VLSGGDFEARASKSWRGPGGPTVMHKGRLHIARGLPDTPALVKELRAFTAKITTASNEQMKSHWSAKGR
jgi:hypothetical protein